MVIQTLIDLIYPRRCVACDELLQQREYEQGICRSCKKQLPYVEAPGCMKCGKHLANPEQEYCMDCMKLPKSYIKGYPVFQYIDPMRESMLRFKYKNRREYANYYAQELYQQYKEAWQSLQFDAIIPVPVHAHKRRKRGYNQAELIARELSKLLRQPVISDLLVRVVDTSPQKELNDKQRINNLKKAFKIKQNRVQLKKVLLVDDIYTSGATIEACTQVLMIAGITDIYYASVCIGSGY